MPDVTNEPAMARFAEFLPPRMPRTAMHTAVTKNRTFEISHPKNTMPKKASKAAVTINKIEETNSKPLRLGTSTGS